MRSAYHKLNGTAAYNAKKVNLLESELAIWKTGFRSPGHYYSPYPDTTLLREKKDLIFNRNPDITLPGIELRPGEQFDLLKELSGHYSTDMFPLDQTKGARFYFDNQYFCFSDAIFLSSMIQHLKPKKIIEIGSGFSSAVMLDVNEKYFSNKINLTFVEPFPEERLDSLVLPTDNYVIIKDIVQNISSDLFSGLQENDILFIDSSHISKTYSDVNYLIFNILPNLKKGVVIHFHDIFFPFEYPSEWIIDQQRGWNEAYLLRSFLQFNSDFRIELFTSYLERKYKDWFLANMPICLNQHEQWPKPDGSHYLLDTSGQSIYLRKTK